MDALQLAMSLNPTAAVAKEIADIEARQRAGVQAASLEQVKERARERALPGLGPRSRGPGAARPDLPRREPARGLHRPRQGRRRQLRLRPAAPGPDRHPRPQGRGLRPGLERARHRRPHLLPRGGLPRAVGHSRHSPEAARVRAAGGQDPLPLERRPQGDDRPARASCSGRGASLPCPEPTPSPSTTPPTRSPPPSASSAIVDKRRAEVVVEVELLEVNRGRLKEYGIEISSGVAGGRRHRGGDLPRSHEGHDTWATTPTTRTTWW